MGVGAKAQKENEERMYKLFQMNCNNGLMQEWKFKTISCATKWADKRDVRAMTVYAGSTQYQLKNQKHSGWTVVSTISDQSSKKTA